MISTTLLHLVTWRSFTREASLPQDADSLISDWIHKMSEKKQQSAIIDPVATVVLSL